MCGEVVAIVASRVRVPPDGTTTDRTEPSGTPPIAAPLSRPTRHALARSMYERGILTPGTGRDSPSMVKSSGRAFNEWLRTQLKAKKMSQRQLAQQSGVDHSTISRLVRGDRMPSLGTATKLARGLRELGEQDDGPQYLGVLGSATQNPTARIEYALRADEALNEPQVRQIMEYYLAVRMRHLARPNGTEPSPLRRVEPAATVARAGNGYQGQASAASSAVSGVRVAVASRQPPSTLRPIRNDNGY
jgi:transcriptional regulator with XRE-family HTH domain